MSKKRKQTRGNPAHRFAGETALGIHFDKLPQFARHVQGVLDARRATGIAPAGEKFTESTEEWTNGWMPKDPVAMLAQLPELFGAASSTSERAFRSMLTAARPDPTGASTDSLIDQDIREERAKQQAIPIESGLRDAECRVVEALRVTAPSAALVPFRGESTSSDNAGDTDRFAWLLAVLGRGDDDSVEAWERYIDAARSWLAEYLLYLMVSSSGSKAFSSIDTTVAISRLMPRNTKFRWISDLACEAIGSWADTQPEVIQSAFGSSSMTRLNDAVAQAIRDGSILDPGLYDGIHPTLIQTMTAPPARDVAGFADLLLSEVPDVKPFVHVGGTALPIYAPAWFLDRETTLIAAIRDLYGGDVSGPAFEHVVTYAASKIAPEDVRVYGDATIVRPGTSKKAQGSQVDLLLAGPGLLAVGEAKGYIPASSPAGASATYERQLLHSLNQIKTRMERLEQGWVFVDHPELSESRAMPIGLSITLHEYGGTTWRGDVLRESEQNPYVMVPFGTFILVLSCMPNAQEVSDYFDYRFRLLTGPVAGLDELEQLLGWLNDDGTPTPPPTTSNAMGVMRPYRLQSGFDLRASRPTSRRQWIETLYAYSHPADHDGETLISPSPVDRAQMLARLRRRTLRVLAGEADFWLHRVADMYAWWGLWQSPGGRADSVAVTAHTVADALRENPESVARLRRVNSREATFEAILLYRLVLNKKISQVKIERFLDGPERTADLMIKIVKLGQVLLGDVTPHADRREASG